MDINEIKKRFELLKKIEGGTLVLVSKLAKELKIRETDLMLFIEGNPNLFETEYKYSVKKERYTYTMMGKRFTDTQNVKDKLLGLALKEVYLTPSDNIHCEEGIQKRKEDYSKYIFIREFDNYGSIEGYYIEIDEPRKNNNNVHLWRNTKEKIEELKKLHVVSPGVFWLGGFGDCSKCERDYVITEKGLATLIKNGWSYNKLKPLRKY